MTADNLFLSFLAILLIFLYFASSRLVFRYFIAVAFLHQASAMIFQEQLNWGLPSSELEGHLCVIIYPYLQIACKAIHFQKTGQKKPHRLILKMSIACCGWTINVNGSQYLENAYDETGGEKLGQANVAQKSSRHYLEVIVKSSLFKIYLQKIAPNIFLSPQKLYSKR